MEDGEYCGTMSVMKLWQLFFPKVLAHSLTVLIDSVFFAGYLLCEGNQGSQGGVTSHSGTHQIKRTK
jgi:hypothetical protein